MIDVAPCHTPSVSRSTSRPLDFPGKAAHVLPFSTIKNRMTAHSCIRASDRKRGVRQPRAPSPGPWDRLRDPALPGRREPCLQRLPGELRDRLSFPRGEVGGAVANGRGDAEGDLR